MTLNPDDLVVRLAEGEELPEAAQAALDPPITASLRFFDIKSGNETGLHYHDHDEYWLFTEGHTRVTLRTPQGVRKEFEIGPYTLIATAKGIEHGHAPHTDVKGLEWVGPLRPGGQPGHLTREQ